jgi:hypothetical protein
MKPFLALAGTALAVASLLASPYDVRRAAAVKQCETIDPASYQSGLYFNPDGYRSYYLRSECFQKVAIRFRDVSLCAQVKQRRALLSSSWGYSPGNCRTLVAATLAKDRRTLEDTRRAYRSGHMTLRDFRIELDNNGRDFDFIPLTIGTSPHGYSLQFEVLPASGEPILLHSDGYWVDNSSLRIYIKRSDVRQFIPDLSPDRRYTVRATMTFSLPATSGEAVWSEKFADEVFPVRERSQTVTKIVAFPREGTPSGPPRRR